MKHADELHQLAEFLYFKVPDESFDMGIWGAREAEYLDQYSSVQLADCGFAGCAIGWGIHSGILKGIHLKDIAGELSPQMSEGSGISMDAVVGYFKIAYGEAEHLFGSDGGRNQESPKAVALRIKEFLQEQGLE